MQDVKSTTSWKFYWVHGPTYVCYIVWEDKHVYQCLYRNFGILQRAMSSSLNDLKEKDCK